MDRSFWTDQPILEVNDDRFDFYDYAEALSQFLLKGRTPVTVGIFGPWGSGKTSLMRLIMEKVLNRRTAEHRLAHVVWFNAWQHEREPGPMRRSLLLEVLEGLKGLDLSQEAREEIEDLESRLYAELEMGKRILKIDWAKPGKGTLSMALPFEPQPHTVVELLKVFDGKAEALENALGSIRQEELEGHRRQFKLLQEFREKLAEIVHEQVWTRNGLLLVFVDDLDRCRSEHTLQVLETIKLLLDLPGCACFIAADHERIERVVRERYGMQEEGVGESYLEKLVQLPFYLPPLEEAQMVEFVANSVPDLSPEVHRIFAYGLPPNPRMLKRILNIYRLLETLAQRRISRGRMLQIDPTLLAKMVVIQNRYRDLYHDLLEYPNLLQEIELRARADEPVEEENELIVPGLKPAAPLISKYLQRRPLARILRVGASFAGLTPLEVGSYLHLISTTGQEQATAPDPFQRLWDELLSGDWGRIRAGVAVVSQRKMEREYAEALTKLMSRNGDTPFRQRLSAAWALGYLGDPRPLDETVLIPGGEFPYGKEQLLYYLLPYRISRHLVTNAQYAKFLQAHPEIPVPHVGEGWARTFNWDSRRRIYPEGKGNWPVVLVAWEEAAAYCTWVGGRLPKQEEWERAARGTDGRIYPWGNHFDARWANTREGGLGSPTPVGIFTEGRSPEGLYDVAGNVWEWTASDYNLQTKVIRGGAWNFPSDSAQLFASERSQPDHRSHTIGFRVAFSLSQDAAKDGDL